MVIEKTDFSCGFALIGKSHFTIDVDHRKLTKKGCKKRTDFHPQVAAFKPGIYILQAHKALLLQYYGRNSSSKSYFKALKVHDVPILPLQQWHVCRKAALEQKASLGASLQAQSYQKSLCSLSLS